MRSAFGIILFFASSVVLLAGTQEEIAQSGERLRQALVSRDAAALQQLLDDEFRVVHVNGRQQDKPQFIEALQSGRAKFLSIEIDEQEVHDLGDTAIVTARWNNTIEFKGERNHGQDRVTNVWMKRPTNWRLVSSSAVYLAPTADASPNAPTAADDEKEIMRLETLLQDSWLKHDVAAVSAIVADDLGYWSFKGTRRGKEDLLKLVAQTGEASTRVDDARVRVLGDTGIYTARITDAGKDEKGEPFEARTLVTSIFVRRHGKWQMVQDHESLIQK